MSQRQGKGRSKKNEDSAGGDFLTWLIAALYFFDGKVAHTHTHVALLPFCHSKVCPRNRRVSSMIAISNLLDYRNGPGLFFSVGFFRFGERGNVSDNELSCCYHRHTIHKSEQSDNNLPLPTPKHRIKDSRNIFISVHSPALKDT